MSEAADRLYERVLVLRCQAGDEAAFAELVQRYAPRLRYYIRKMFHDDHRAEDILQDVWFDAHRALPRLADPGALAAWLYRIARDHTFRHLRKRQLPLTALDDVEIEETPSNASDFTP